MRYLTIFLMLMSAVCWGASSSSAPTKQTTTHEGKYTVTHESTGIVQEFANQADALRYEKAASKSCLMPEVKNSCKYRLKQPDIIVDTFYVSSSSKSSKATSSKSSSVKSSAPTVVSISRPLARVDKTSLAADEIITYELVKVAADGSTVATLIPASTNNPFTFTVPYTVAASDVLKIATNAKQSLRSEYVTIK